MIRKEEPTKHELERWKIGIRHNRKRQRNKNIQIKGNIQLYIKGNLIHKKKIESIKEGSGEEPSNHIFHLLFVLKT